MDQERYERYEDTTDYCSYIAYLSCCEIEIKACLKWYLNFFRCTT